MIILVLSVAVLVICIGFVYWLNGEVPRLDEEGSLVATHDAEEYRDE